MPQTESAAAGVNGVENTSAHEYAYVRERRIKRERGGREGEQARSIRRNETSVSLVPSHCFSLSLSLSQITEAPKHESKQ